MRPTSTLCLTLALTTSLALGACATTPDPAKVCTAEWITPRADRAVNELKRDMGRSIKKLSRSAEKLQSGRSISPFALASMMNTAQGMVKKIETSRGLKDLRILSETCNDPEIIKDSFMGFLDDMGVPQQFRILFENMEALQLPNRANPAIKDTASESL